MPYSTSSNLKTGSRRRTEKREQPYYDMSISVPESLKPIKKRLDTPKREICLPVPYAHAHLPVNSEGIF